MKYGKRWGSSCVGSLEKWILIDKSGCCSRVIVLNNGQNIWVRIIFRHSLRYHAQKNGMDGWTTSGHNASGHVHHLRGGIKTPEGFGFENAFTRGDRRIQYSFEDTFYSYLCLILQQLLWRSSKRTSQHLQRPLSTKDNFADERTFFYVYFQPNILDISAYE